MLAPLLRSNALRVVTLLIFLSGLIVDAHAVLHSPADSASPEAGHQHEGDSARDRHGDHHGSHQTSPDDPPPDPAGARCCHAVACPGGSLEMPAAWELATEGPSVVASP
jgi:hypothetical protein